MMGVPMRKRCSNEEEENVKILEGADEDVRVLELPSLNMLQRGR